MALVEYLKTLRRRWTLVLACFLIATAVGFVMSPDEPPEPEGAGYQASLTLIPSPEAVATVNLHLAAHMASGPDVASLAAEYLPSDVRGRPSGAAAFVSGEAGSLTITTTDRDANLAGIYVEAYAAATIDFLQQTTTRSHVDALEAAQRDLAVIEENLADLQDQRPADGSDAVLEARINTETTRYGIVFQRVQDLLSADDPAPPLQVLGTATITRLDPGGISAPTDRRARALLAGALGLVLGLGLALTVDRLDTRLRERDEVEDAFGLPVLAEIPKLGRRARADHALITVMQPDSAAAEAYRSLRSAITLVTHGGRSANGTGMRDGHVPPQVLVIAGAEGSEGKSTTVVNLAAAVAETGRSVIVIDCDFRKPEAHLYLDAKRGNGLADLTSTWGDDFGGYLDQVIRRTSVHGVELVSSMEAVSHPANVVTRLSGLVTDARKRADVVLIDSSPLLITSDSLDILQYADAAVVTCRAGRTTYGKAVRARRILQRADVPLLGVVLTGTPPPRGTPYGKPSRRQKLMSQLSNIVRQPGPDTPPPVRTSSGADAPDPVPAPSVLHEAADETPHQTPGPVTGSVALPDDPTQEISLPTEADLSNYGPATTGRRRRPPNTHT